MSLVLRTQSLDRRLFGWVVGLTISLITLSACATDVGLPAPRSIVNSTGARLLPDADRMAEIDKWVQEQNTNIQQDPSFWIISQPTSQDMFLWDALTIISSDTAEVLIRRTATDANLPYQLYAHFYLMKEVGRLEEFLPEGVGLEGYELEFVVLKRIADAWLYGRSVFDMSPYPVLDELMYASEGGWLDAYVMTARAADFPKERRAWLDANPGRTEAYRAWFKATFDREPPGLR
jgi:hypothetical protein